MTKNMLLFLLFLIGGCGFIARQEKIKNFRELCGVYKLDTTRTNLQDYRQELQHYQQLTLTLAEDATFKMNFAVPFIYDSTGTWYAGSDAPEQWNWMFSARNSNMDIQFSLYFDAPDSVLYLNSVTPREGKPAVSKIFFKRITIEK